jgi:hypothetical protein
MLCEIGLGTMNFLLLGFGLYVCLETQAQPADGSKNGAACIGFCGKYCLDDHGMRKWFFPLCWFYFIYSLCFLYSSVFRNQIFSIWPLPSVYIVSHHGGLLILPWLMPFMLALPIKDLVISSLCIHHASSLYIYDLRRCYGWVVGHGF